VVIQSAMGAMITTVQLINPGIMEMIIQILIPIMSIKK